MGAVWRNEGGDWNRLLPSGFPSEEKLHDLVAGAPGLLPLSGDPVVAVLGREVGLGPGFADLLGVESNGRPVILEIKLRKNPEVRRAVVAQVLTYAAYLKGTNVSDLEELLRPHLGARGVGSIAEAMQAVDDTGDFELAPFSEQLVSSLTDGSFRLVLVLDEAPNELVQLVGYLESVTSGIVIDLITVTAYQAGSEEILVPSRIDPEHVTEGESPRAGIGGTKAPQAVDGSQVFEQSVKRAPSEDQAPLTSLLEWARGLEENGLARLKSVRGRGRDILLVWVPGEKGGLVSIWNDSGAYISLWRSMFVRRAWEKIAEIEDLTQSRMGQGNTIREPSEELLAAIAESYEEASKHTEEWNERDFYVAFGENPQRNWDEARQFGFVSAGGGEWYSKTLHQLQPGHRVFAYIPKGSGVGGYVGAGTVTGEARMAKDFEVTLNGTTLPYLKATTSPEAAQFQDDPAKAEWIVPVEWLVTRTREDALKDSDFFANQNTAVRLRHGYTLQRLEEGFELES